MSLRQQLSQMGDTLPFPEVIEPQTKLLKGVRLLVPIEPGATETDATFLVGKDAYGRSWIYAYLDQAALEQGTAPGQHHAAVIFDDLVEIARANGFGGITIDQLDGASSALLPQEYFDATLDVLRRE